ncbi:hypothetical protein Bca4012_065296 [Brassica carinata]
MPRLHYGPKNSRAYARKRYRGTDGNWVLPMFPDPEEQYREFPFGYPHEQTVERKVLMPHFQRMAMERRILQGHATFQLSPGEEIPRKRGRPSRAPSAVGEPQRAFTGECQCKALFENTQGDRSVVNYTEDFIKQAELCKPKSAEMWCGWYRDGLRGDIKAKLRGILEPLEFALVKRMAGFAIETEAKIAARLDDLSRAEKANTMGDLRMDAGNPGTSAGEPPKKKRGRPSKPPVEPCGCDVLIQMVQKPRTVRDYLEEFLETARRCQPKPAEEWCRLFKAGLREDIRDELAGVLEPLEFALVKRLAGQALDAEERLAEIYARAEPDYPTEDDEDTEPVEGGVGAAGSGSGADRGSSPRGGWLMLLPDQGYGLGSVNQGWVVRASAESSAKESIMEEVVATTWRCVVEDSHDCTDHWTEEGMDTRGVWRVVDPVYLIEVGESWGQAEKDL